MVPELENFVTEPSSPFLKARLLLELLSPGPDQQRRFRSLAFLALALFLLFSCHRIVAMEYLSPQPSHHQLSALRVFLVGSLSDFWLSCLVSLVIGPLHFGILKFNPKFEAFSLGGIYLVALVFTMSHQNYVEFFRFQFVPAHLSYLGDLNFLSASVSELANFGPLIVAGPGLIIGILFMYLCRFTDFWQAQGAKVFGTVFILGIIAHNRNIHFRVQWFVPSELQVHFLERLYFHIKENPMPKPLSKFEVELLADRFNLQRPVAGPSKSWLASLVYPKVSDANPSAEARKIKRSFEKHKNPIVVVVVLESLRTSEFGAYSLSPKPSITPYLDQFARDGLLFENAFSTGTVTRGGQEAVLCGYLGSRNTSMMKNRPDVQLPCITEMVSGEKFWFHGGKGEFDGQVDFWRQRGVTHTLTEADFAPAAAATPWGKSDLALFEKSVQQIQKLRVKFPEGPLLGMVLTLTNHTPWSLPKDAPSELVRAAQELDHGNFRTSLYGDFAFGKFIAAMKQARLWDRSLIIAVSDHGVSGNPYFPQDQELGSLARQKSHIPLVLGGGLMQESGLSGKRWRPFVSQADIAPFLAWLFEKDQQFMGELLLGQERRRPVTVDLGNEIFLPELAKSYSRKQISAGTSHRDDSKGVVALSYYRAVLHFLDKK